MAPQLISLAHSRREQRIGSCCETCGGAYRTSSHLLSGLRRLVCPCCLITSHSLQFFRRLASLGHRSRGNQAIAGATPNNDSTNVMSAPQISTPVLASNL